MPTIEGASPIWFDWRLVAAVLIAGFVLLPILIVSLRWWEERPWRAGIRDAIRRHRK